MKKTLFSLVFLLTAMTAAAQSITGATFTYTFNGVQTTMGCLPSGCETEDLTSTVAENLKIDAVVVQTSGYISDLKMYAANYKSGEKDPEIVDVPLIQRGDIWYIPAEFIQRMDDGYLVKDNNKSTATRYFTFYFVANEDDKNPIIYDNGGNYYSIRYKTDDGQGGGGGETDNITFYDTNTATLTLLVTGGKDSYITYTYNGDGTRDIQDNPGELSSLYIDNFTLRLQRSSSNLEIESVSVQYKVFEEGSDAQWNTMNYSYQEDEGGNILNKKYTGVAATQNLAEGLKPGKTYVLQIKYQVVDNKKNYYFFTPSSWYGEYRFSVKEEGGGGGGTGIRGDVNGDGIVNGTDIQEIINIIVNGE